MKLLVIQFPPISRHFIMGVPTPGIITKLRRNRQVGSTRFFGLLARPMTSTTKIGTEEVMNLWARTHLWQCLF
jgi:hypothetical protein